MPLESLTENFRNDGPQGTAYRETGQKKGNDGKNRGRCKKSMRNAPAMVGIEGKMTEAVKKEKPFHVLVVDDDSLIRHIIPRALKKLEVLVDVAEDGLQAQKKILAGNYDLVITDINMPRMNGVELLLWLKQHRPQVEGIAMTGYEIADTFSNDLSECVTDFISKPFPMTRLQEAVKASMQRLMEREGNALKIN